MGPGLYCLNGELKVNGGGLSGTGVVIYMMPTGGGVSLSGSADINLITGYGLTDNSGNDIGGYLIFMDLNNHNGVDMAGSNGSYYQGTVYAPGYRDPASQEKCNIGGSNTSTAMHSNIVCYSIGVAGNSSVRVVYNPTENHIEPAAMELSQ